MFTKKITFNKIKKRMGLIDKKLTTENDKSNSTKSWLEVLTSYEGISKDANFRVKMTLSCKDSDYIPKVNNAGKYKKIGGVKYQVMHNGLLVESGGYFGEWMEDIIKQLKGHHEPQEEKIFYELLKKLPKNSTMLELGSYWAYYSLWFNKALSNSTNYCCEPDPENILLGKRNAKINNAKNMMFIQSAAGNADGKLIKFQPQENLDHPKVSVPIRTVDSLVKEFNIPQLDILHMDVQGVELDALKGAEQVILAKKIRFVFVSTHHYAISEDLQIHEKCLEFIIKSGGHIIAEHAIHESFSGDGLIVASFFEEDINFKINISTNRMDTNLFRPYLKDLEIISNEYERLRKSL